MELEGIVEVIGATFHPIKSPRYKILIDERAAMA